MEFEWDENKRASNILKHKLDLAAGALLFDGQLVHEYGSSCTTEDRWITVGLLNDALVALVWTWRGEKIRLISLRKARDGERRKYRERDA